MAIGTPAALGEVNNSSAVNTLAISSTANAVASGDMILIAFGFSKTSNTPTITDSSSNSYTIVGPYEFITGFEWGYFAYCLNATAMAGGSTITLNYSGSASRPVMAAITVSGIATASALDQNVTTTPTSGTSGTVTTGTLVQASEIVFGIWYGNNPGATFTQGSGFTALNPSGAAGNDYIRWGYQIVAATTAVTYAPSWTSSTGFGIDIISFKAAAAAAASSPTLMMMGV